MTRWVRWVLALVCCMAAPLAVAQSRFSLTTQIGHLRVVEGFESIEPCLEAVGHIRPDASAFIEVAEAARDTLTLDELSALCLVGRQVGPGRYALGPAAPQDAPAVAAAMSPERPAARRGVLRIHPMPAAQAQGAEGLAAAEGVAATGVVVAQPVQPQQPQPPQPPRPQQQADAATAGTAPLRPRAELLALHARLMREAEHQPSYRAQLPPPPQVIVPAMLLLRLPGKLPPHKPP
jgi:hypothetical protein